MHADVIAGRQFNQTLNKIMKDSMNKYVNPPSNSSLATSFIVLITKILSSSGRENEVGRRSPLAGDVVEEGALEIDEREVEESVSPVPPFVPNLSVAEIEGVECVRRVLEQSSSEAIENTERALERDDDNDDDGNDSFVEVDGDEQTDEGQYLRVSFSLRLSCEQTCCQRLFWREVSVHPNCHCVSLHSSTSLAFLLGIIQWPSIFPIS